MGGRADFGLAARLVLGLVARVAFGLAETALRRFALPLALALAWAFGVRPVFFLLLAAGAFFVETFFRVADFFALAIVAPSCWVGLPPANPAGRAGGGGARMIIH